MKACPLENSIRQILDRRGIKYIEECEHSKYLDFYLTDYGVYLEIKGGHTNRINDQMKRDFNIICIQGMKSVAFLEKIL